MSENEKKNPYEGLKGYELERVLADEHIEWQAARRIEAGGLTAEMNEQRKREDLRHDAIIGGFKLQCEFNERCREDTADNKRHRDESLVELRRNNEIMERIAVALEVFSRRAP